LALIGKRLDDTLRHSIAGFSQTVTGRVNKSHGRKNMAEKNSKEDLLKKKFEPISDWKPCKPASGTDGLETYVSDAIDSAQKGLESLMKSVEPLKEQADANVKKMAASLEVTAEQSSKEAREWLAKTLEGLAEKIKPSD
jgi:hypothetical protein